MALDQISKNHIGLPITITFVDDDDTTTALDISSATTKTIKLQVHNGTSSTHAASWATTNNGSDGQITYTTVDGDLDTVGNWRVMGYAAETTSPEAFHTQAGSFNVFEVL